ncbi:MAG: DUF1848 domain-containing protein [Anaerolineales bacterium]|nr:DUF1848 domain-containing protein [Anaerolineales bacterium]
MIISASRRTDIPAFYAPWFIHRIRAGFCTVPNPFNPAQVSHVSLLPADVDVIVFWTRNPRPLFPYLDELDQRGYYYYFQYTLLDYPRPLETSTPRLPAALHTFRQLSHRLGPQRLIWRYDPILLTPRTPVQFHLDRYRQIAQALEGCTRRSVISLHDLYPKTKKRLAALKDHGLEILDPQALPADQLAELLTGLAAIAHQHGLEIFSCAETLDLAPYGIQPGKCIDDDYIHRTFGLQVSSQKDPSQRQACGCVVSRDIGMYDTCLFGCSYCYATTSFTRARRRYTHHNPLSPSLVGWHE